MESILKLALHAAWGVGSFGRAEGVRFDTKYFGHVVWDSPTDFRTALAHSISANMIPKR